MKPVAPGVAALAMYDFDEIREPVQELWAAVSGYLGDGPVELTWEGDLHEQWLDPSLVLGLTCGWPLITSLRDKVTVVGAFHYDIGDGVAAPIYRSVLVAAQPAPLRSFAAAVGALNDTDSLSGCISLGVAVAECSDLAPFFGEVVETGSHLASMAAVKSGRAALASIDAVTHALTQRYRPQLTDGLVVVGRGPAVPTLPLITAAPDPEPLRRALEKALTDPATAPYREDALITGFSPLDAADYDGLSALGEAAATALGVKSRLPSTS